VKSSSISRRQFALIAGSAGAAPFVMLGADPLTAENVVRRIQTALGGEWSAAGPDGFKAGDTSTVVKGIATTAMATLDVLKQAVKAGANLVVTYEPTFYGRSDGAPSVTGRGLGGPATDDPVVKAKREFIAKNGLVVFRLRDHWQAKKANETVAAFAEALGWSKYRLRSDDALYDIPAATAEATVNAIRGRLNLRAGLRAVGDRKATVRRVLLHPGVMPLDTMWQRYSEVDLALTGEVREWENTFYAADIFTAGEKRSLVTVGRVVSEEPGMRLCTDWLKTIVPLPARWIGAGDPYWRPV
jgi:hypothetical protein